MPRGVQNRLLTYNNNQVVTPFGYTAKAVAFIDSDGSQRLNPATSRFIVSGGSLNGIQSVNQAPKAYREFEIWTGVPSIKAFGWSNRSSIWARRRRASRNRTVCWVITRRRPMPAVSDYRRCHQTPTI